jgi:uncharacterized membrane protein
MGTMVKMKNVGRGEAIFRSVVGVILIILAFISGFSQWVLGLIGVVIVLTALFGY